jgi:hypothetical protein
MLSQLSSNIAQSLISSKPNRSGDEEQSQISVTAPAEKQRPDSKAAPDPPKQEVRPIADTSLAINPAESGSASSRANTTSESGAVTALGAVSVPVSAPPEGVEGAVALGIGNVNPPQPREGQMRTRGMGRRGSRRRKVVLPAIGEGGEEAPIVRSVRKLTVAVAEDLLAEA